MRYFLTVIILVLVFFSSHAWGQAVGFGCLGFVSGYGGYSYQKYNPAGLNDYIGVFNELRNDSMSSPMGDFGSASGYRIGFNFFRANLEGFILTTKGFYQRLSEKQKTDINSFDGTSSAEFNLVLKNWGVGVDLGTSLTKALSWKVLDASLIYTSAEFSDTRNYPNAFTEVNKFESESWSFGYSIGTGFILEIVDEYISIEGLAGYTVFTIDKVKMDETYLTVDEQSDVVMPNFIETGGFNAVIQLNIGFPL
ncbi:MAG: hypothetical protein R6W90_02910 [Ignavibacteriaceae bacterium]